MEDYDRRNFLNLSVGTFAALTTGGLLTSCSKIGPITYQQFIDELALHSESLSKNADSEDVVVDRVKALLQRLDLTAPNMAHSLKAAAGIPLNFSGWGYDNLTEHRYFEVALLNLPKGQRIPAHNHPRMAGAFMLTKGATHLRQFDLLKGNAKDREVSLDLVYDKVARTGTISSLTSRKDNIHSLVAQEDTVLIDVFLPGYDDGRIEETYYYNILPEGNGQGGMSYRGMRT